jgi:tRNA G18 (ribose-2'-O)-methylase SpoU
MDPALEPFHDLRAGPGRFIVEGVLAIERLLRSEFEVESLCCTASARARLAELIPARVPVFELDKRALAELAGFDFHRGVLACAKRPAPRVSLTSAELERLRGRARLRVVVAEQLADPRNLGALIRNLAAFSADLLVADARGADPFSRMAIRAGVGNVFGTAMIVSDDLPRTVTELAHGLGAAVIAATPDPAAVDLRELEAPERLILLVGNEGAGLSPALLSGASLRVRIPVAPGSDSLNVAAATAVLLYALMG